MKRIPEKDIDTAVKLFAGTYNTDTVEQMNKNQERYREYTGRLGENFGVKTQTINDIVWERFQIIRAREIKEEKNSRQWRMKRNVH